MFHQARRPPRTAFVGASGRASRRFEPTLSRHEKHASDTGEGLHQTVGISDRRDGDLASLLGPWPIVTLGDERASARSKSESLTSSARKPPPGEQTPPTGRVGTAALTAFWSTCHRLCRCSCSAQLCLPDYSAVAAQRWDCRWAILDYLAKRQRSARCPRPRSDWSEEYLAKRQSSGRCSRPRSDWSEVGSS